MKKEGIQKRKRKPKSNTGNESQQINQNHAVAAQHHLQLSALQPHATSQTHHLQLNPSHTHHSHAHLQSHVHHNNHSQHSNQNQLHVHHTSSNQQHMLGLSAAANQLQQQVSTANNNTLIHQSNGSNNVHHHPSHHLSHVSNKDLILNQASNGSNSNGNVTAAHLNLNRALHLNKLDDLTMVMGGANGHLSTNQSNGNAINANNLIIVEPNLSNLHQLTKFTDVLYHQNNGIANLNGNHASTNGHHLEHSLSSSSGQNGELSLSSDHSPNSEMCASPNTPTSAMLTRAAVNIIPVESFFYPNTNVKLEAKN